MLSEPSGVLQTLRYHAGAYAGRSYAPFSGRLEAAVLLLSDGQWIPGVRVESASFSLTIPALLNAFTTATAVGRRDVVAVVQNVPLSPQALHYLATGPLGIRFRPHAADAMLNPDHDRLPEPDGLFHPFLSEADTAGAPRIRLARSIAARAYIPESHFPVGCLLETREGHLLPGVNVEHPDWSSILCAERNALSTAVTYGLQELRKLYLTCPTDPTGSPCGACRQLLAEQAPELEVWMDRGEASPERTNPTRLLPGSFTGIALRDGPG